MTDTLLINRIRKRLTPNSAYRSGLVVTTFETESVWPVSKMTIGHIFRLKLMSANPIGSFAELLLKRSIFVLIISLFFFNSAVSQHKPPTDKTVFWEITPKKGGKPSYLYGTMHVSKKVAFRLPNSLYDAVKNSDVVALESNPEMWSEALDQSKELKDLFSLMNVGLNSMLLKNSSFYGRTYGLQPISNDLIIQQLSYEPNSVNDLLFRSYGRQQNFEEDTYLDLYIFKTGKKFGKPIASLEDIVWSTITVLKASTAEENKHSNVQYTGNLDEDMEDAYRDQDLVKLDSIQRASSPSEKYIEGLLYIRNDTMFKNIESHIKQGKSIFAAVGAAHLAGDKGLLVQFLNAGYQVRPILDASRLDPSSKINSLDSVYLPVSYSRKYAQDSTISFVTPVYTSRSSVGGRVEYLASDMTNGVYYHVSRINAMLTLSGLTPSRIEEKFDSLLFENMEGSILSKKKLKWQSYPSLQVTSKTKDGKLNKLMVVITPLEIIMAKVVGKENYFRQQNTDTFFNSLSIQYKKERNTFNISDMSLKMPVSVSDNSFGTYNFNGPNMIIQGLDEDGDYFQFLRNYCVRQTEHEEDTFHLNMYAYFMAKAFNMKIKEQRNLVQNGLPMVQVVMQNELKKKVFVRILQRGSTIYFITVASNNRSKADHVFDSFILQADIRPEAHWYTDTEQHFTFRTHLEPIGGSLRKELFSQFANNDEDRPRKSLYTAVFADTGFGYQFTIGIEELNKFEAYPSVDSFWSYFYKNQYEEDEELDKKHVVIDHSAWQANNQYYMQVNMRCANSQNISHFLYILSGNKLMVCQTFRDSTQPNYRFVDTVLKSIRFTKPTEPTLLLSKLDTFMTYMSSKDSVMKEYFNKQSSQLFVLQSDEAKLYSLLDTSEVLKRKDEQYTMMMWFLAEFKKPSTLDYIRKLYKRNVENLDRQNTLLAIVAQMNDSASTTLFRNLILDEPPLEFESDDSPLNHYYDTLMLARILFPEIKDLMDLDDYKWDVIYLMDDLLKHDLIDSSMYTEKVNYFVMKGKEEIRRKTAQKSTLEEEQDKMEDVDEEDKTTSPWSSIGSDFHLIDEKENYSSTINFTDFYLIKSFARLLTPYRNRENVKEFFNKLDSTSNMDLRFDLAMENMRNKKNFDSSVVKEYASLPKYYYKIVHEFYVNEAIEKLPFKVDGQKEIARAKISDELELNPADSLTFMNKIWVKGRTEQGYIYIFKHRKEKDKTSFYDFMGLFNKDPKKIIPEKSILRCNIELEKKSFSEWEEQLHDQFRVMDRVFIQTNDMIRGEE